MSDDQKTKHGAAGGRRPEAGAKTEADQSTTQPPRTQSEKSGQAAGPEVRPAGGEQEQAASVKVLQEENAQLKDQLLRRAAESENFRKRMFRERDEGIRHANASLLEDLLPVIDDFERAIASAAASRDFDSLHGGVSLIERQLVSMLERNWGLKRFSAAGESFDPQRHEAIAVQESGEHAEPVVLEDVLKGYYLHDRVLRPAKVKVSKPAGPDEAKGKNSTSSK